MDDIIYQIAKRIATCTQDDVDFISLVKSNRIWIVTTFFRKDIRKTVFFLQFFCKNILKKVGKFPFLVLFPLIIFYKRVQETHSMWIMEEKNTMSSINTVIYFFQQ